MRSFGHRSDRAHAAIGFEASPAVNDRVARAFGEPGEESADHDDMGTGGNRLGDIARIANPAVGDDRNPAGRRLGRLVDRGDLGHAHARDNPRRANRARPDPYLHGIGTRLDQRTRSLTVATLPATT